MVFAVMGAMLPPIPPSDATELRLPIALRALYLHPVITAVLRPYSAQPDCFQRESGSTLRVMSTLVCQSDLSGLRTGAAYVPRGE